MRIAIAGKLESWLGLAVVSSGRGGEPNLAGTALDLVIGSALVVAQGLERAAQFNNVTIAVFPLVEKFEIGQDRVEAHGAHALR